MHTAKSRIPAIADMTGRTWRCSGWRNYEDFIIVELKAVKTLVNALTAQCINDLKASRLRLCLLRNFGKPGVIG
jgi:hypothetical protein